MAAILTGYAEPSIVHPGARRKRKSDGANYNFNTLAYEAYSVGNISRYATTATEQSPGEYEVADPTPTVDGSWLLYSMAAATLAVGDLVSGLRWEEPVIVSGPVTLAAGAITTASIADGAITDAKINFPDEAAGRPTTFLAAMRRVWERIGGGNKKTRNRTTGVVTLRNADESATLESFTQSTSGAVDTETQGA